MNKNNPENHLPEAFFEKFLLNQEKEIVLKTQEMELAKQKDKHTYEYSTKALEANKNDRDAQRQMFTKVTMWRYIFLIIAIAIIVGFLLLAMQMDKDLIAMEVIKAIVYLAAGGFGGYAFGKTRKNFSANQNE